MKKVTFIKANAMYDKGRVVSLPTAIADVYIKFGYAKPFNEEDKEKPKRQSKKK